MKHLVNFLTILLLLSLLAGCVVPAPVETADPAAEAEAANAEDAAADDGCEEGFRLFDHELMATEPVCVPESPERVAMLETIGSELMYTLGIKPVVQFGPYTQQLIMGFPMLEESLSEFFNDIPDGGYAEVNLEVLAREQPDLIVTYDINLGVADELNAIAPTVFLKLLPEVDLPLALDFEGKLLSLEDEVAEMLDQYEERVSAVREQVVPAINGKSVVVVRADGSPLAFFANSPAYSILQEAGWQPSSEFAATLDEISADFAYGIRPVSMEELSLLDGDYLFVYNLAGDTELANIMESPLWQTLSVVRNEQAHVVPNYWNFNGILSAHFMMDDFLRILGNADPAEVSPNPFLSE